MNNAFDFKLTLPKLRFAGKYSMNMNVLFLRVNGKGDMLGNFSKYLLIRRALLTYQCQFFTRLKLLTFMNKSFTISEVKKRLPDGPSFLILQPNLNFVPKSRSYSGNNSPRTRGHCLFSVEQGKPF